MITPDVSVVVPVYNTLDYLGACLDSLVQQSIAREPGRLEVVAVDDGSTDGSGELLDRYAADHPGVVHVVHQANSGGPARPCNVGLDHARGRYVIFVGSDDYLALDALERLVAAADAWDSDVVVPPAEGVNGRHVDQRLFEQEHPAIEFPGELMPFSLSNTKLFRRSLIEEHGLRYPLDLRIGSDQPFAVAAMLAARRVSVLARPTAYFAVKRHDAGNISYAADWRTRLADLTAVVEHLAEVVAPGPVRDALLVRHFSWEFDKLLTRDLLQRSEEDADALLDALAAVAGRFLTPELLERLDGAVQLHWRLISTGRRDLVRSAVGPVAPGSRLLLERGGLWLLLDGLDEPTDVSRLTGLELAPWFEDVERRGRLILDGSRLRLEARTAAIDPASDARIELALSPLNEHGVPRTWLNVAHDRGTRVLAAAPLHIGADGDVRAELDLADLAVDTDPGVTTVGLRLRVTTDRRILDRPLRMAPPAASPESSAAGAAEFTTRGARAQLSVTSSLEDRLALTLSIEPTLRRRVGALGRRLT